MKLSVVFEGEAEQEELYMTPSLYVLSGEHAVDVVRRLKEKGQSVACPEKVRIIIDRAVPPHSPEVSLKQRELMDFARETEISFSYGKGMAVYLLKKEWQAETLFLGCDPDIYMAGGPGAIGLCLSAEEMAEALTKSSWKVEQGPMVTVQVTGHLPKGVSISDGARDLLSRWKGKWPAGGVLAFLDDYSDLTDEEWMVLCGAMQKLPIRTVARLIHGWKEAPTDVLDLSQVKPSLDVGQGHIVNEMPRQAVKAVFIGGAYGGSLADVAKAAALLKGKKVAYGVRLSVAPASAEVYAKAADAGYLTDIMEAGGLVLNQCAAAPEQGRIGAGEVLISNDIHNEEGYAGEKGIIYLASTETAVQAAVSGQIGKTETVAKKADRVLEGRVWKFGDDIDTDIIIPTQHLSYPDWEEVKQHMFEPLRPELAAQIQEGDILVAGSNFGCGSSREQAAEVIATSGIRCVIAKSFARIFFRNAINNGVLLIECPSLPDQVQEGDTVQVHINQYILHKGKKYAIPRMPDNLYQLIQDGGLVKSVQKKNLGIGD